MKKRFARYLLSLSAVSSLATAVVWSNDGHACAAEPLVASVCLMATPWPSWYGFAVANGAQMPINQYEVLYSLIGTTYGGDGSTYFQLPDLRGRMAIGAGQGTGLPNYYVGGKGGNLQVSLTVLQLPGHNHSIPSGGIGFAVDMTNVKASTTLTGLNATTSLAGVTATVAGSGLTVNAINSTAGTGSPNGAMLASTGLNKIYAVGSSPLVAMATGSIGGTASVAFNGNPTTEISSGTVATILTGAPTVTATAGITANNGGSGAINILPPYLTMNYYIATTGSYPQQNN